MGQIIPQHDYVKSHINPNKREWKDNTHKKDIPSYLRYNKYVRHDGIFISKKFIREHPRYTKEIALAMLIKKRFGNSCVYDYNPHKFATMFNINYNTARKYVATLIDLGVAYIHHGNLVIKRITNRKNHNNGDWIKVTTLKNTALELRKFIIDSEITSQIKAIDFKRGIQSAALGKTLKDIKYARKHKDYLNEIGDVEIDEKVRVTISRFCDALCIGKRDAVSLRRKMIEDGYGFSYETKCVGIPAKYVYDDVLKPGYFIFKGNVYKRESWVNL